MMVASGVRRASALISIAAVAATMLCGCVTQQVLPYQASVANQMKLGSLPRTARFQVAPVRGEPSDVHTTIRAEVTGRFIVRQGVSVRYDKVLRADARWDSAFLGVIAASSGLNQSTAIFQALLRKLFADPDFACSAT
jgi:hypothetical protein